ncbi:bacteriocin-like protein [Chryseobacterium formosus]|uniref:bacteriocin-like protein n=1 Tax=Chryseobacterium formosus TaxID=1537363 RepID=UPI0038992902
MKNLKKLSRENLKKLKGGGRIMHEPLYPCYDIRDVSHCYGDYYNCAVHSNSCTPMEFCGQTLYCMW